MSSGRHGVGITPISEAAFTGIRLGAAGSGFRPVVHWGIFTFAFVISAASPPSSESSSTASLNKPTPCRRTLSEATSRSESAFRHRRDEVSRDGHALLAGEGGGGDVGVTETGHAYEGGAAGWRSPRPSDFVDT